MDNEDQALLVGADQRPLLDAVSSPEIEKPLSAIIFSKVMCPLWLNSFRLASIEQLSRFLSISQSTRPARR
jgi:hypothetical protein